MMKPTIPNTEEEVLDHFPHLLLVHNKAQMTDFTPANFKTMQNVGDEALFNLLVYFLNRCTES